jgi:NAD(P)-dependent dehydrogenase (short-subunit alcohol dehydrogenase family)
VTYRDLTGLVALVTGASSGVGAATALGLAREGVTVYAAARRAHLLQELVSHSPHRRGDTQGVPDSSAVIPTPLDITERAAVERAASTIQQDHGRLDLLVNAAGINIPRRRLGELSAEDWQRVMATNATAPFYVIQACLPLLRAAQGLVIVVASVSSRWPDASGPAYQASKHAVLGLTHAVALEEWEHGIRASAILPGMIDTPMLDCRPEPPPPEVRALGLKAEDVAGVCLFLCRLHPRVFIPEIVVLANATDRIGGNKLSPLSSPHV